MSPARTKVVGGVRRPYTDEENAQRDLDVAAAEADNVSQAAEQYKLDRRRAYPLSGDQLDMIWKAIDAMNGGRAVPADALQMLADIKQVKADNPKPA